ncbi:T9SS type A sorting domain-containing protein [Portibacter marinus]|uniref:T9SS type A sorting domain-containing protein n=1 Tax=Portibacter marinus TaxID=2898660 RepID=UPI001F2E5E0E|nr:T9SS type A sorting domain-containing protein [Portibacter marinus]
MKLRITLSLLTALCAVLSLQSQVIWGGPGDPNGEFAGGLNDWTTVAIASLNPDSVENAVWIWDEDAIPNRGAYGVNATILESPSAANGAAYFDSDFYDNGGTQGAFGEGPAPSPQTSELISPLIDLSGEQDVVLTFYQKFRNFSAETVINVSGDGGATFTPFPINSDVALNATSTGTFQAINISEVAGGQSEVVIKFTWSGDYYYWIVDDVAITRLPNNDLTIIDDETSPFYTPHSAVQPVCAIENDPFFFSTSASNSGADTIFNMTYKVSIYNNDTEDFIFSDSVVYDVWAPTISDSTIFIEDNWTPEGLVPGIYRIEHELINPNNSADFNPADNVAIQFFEVSSTTFAKEFSGNGRFGTWNDGEFYAVGAFYQLGPDCAENYTISSVDYAVGQVGADTLSPLVGRPVQFWLWKLTVPLDSFDTSTNYEEDIINISHPSMEFVAFSLDEIDEEDAAANIIVSDEPFLSIDGDIINPQLEPGETYGIFAHWGTDGSTSPLHLFVSDVNTTTDLFYSGGWFGGFSDTKSAPILRLQLELESSVDDIPLSAEAFKVYPNPTSDLINLELNLETNSDATITIADVTGRVISYQNLSKVQSETLSINVSNYVSGTYLARVATDIGTKTIKFVVQ